MSAHSETIRALFARAYAPLRLRGKSAETTRQYEIQFTHFHAFLSREPTLTDLVDETVNAFLFWFRAQGAAAPTVNKARNHLLALWRFAARKRLVEHFPDVPPDVEPDRVPVAWLDHELLRLLAACADEPGYLRGILAAKWWKALHFTFWDTAERKTALLSLKWQTVDLTSGWAVFPAEIRKGKKRDRAYPLHCETVAALREIAEPPRELVFPWPYSPAYIYPRYNKILRRAGLPIDRKRKFHCLRRTVASYYEAAGGNATEFLDHTTRRVTQAYLDPRIVPHADATRLLFRPDRPRPPLTG